MSKVSVIVPVYGVEAYVRECVESILAQTFTDYEAILVDDGSPDGCGAILDEYAARDPRVRVIHKENGGLSSARNAGLEAATGDYVYFVDGDDRIRPELLEKVVPKMDLGYDLVIFNHERFPVPWEEKGFLTEEAEVVPGEGPQMHEFLCTDFIRGKYHWEVWNRIYSREIIEKHHLRFMDNRKIFMEDLAFNFCYMPFVRRFYCLTDLLYEYRMREGSIMADRKGKTYLKESVALVRELRDFYRSHPETAYLGEHFLPIYYMIARGGLRHLDRARLAACKSVGYARRYVRREVEDWEEFTEQCTALVGNREMFRHYIGFRTKREQLMEWTFVNAVCGKPTVLRHLLSVGYNLAGIPGYFYLKYKVMRRRN